MVKIFTIISLLLSVVLMGTMPWLSALIYSTVSVLQPQYIWFWAFDGFSVFKLSAGVAILAWIVQAINGNINWKVYSTGQYKGVVGMMVIFYLSSWFSPFPNYVSSVRGDVVVSNLTVIVVMYTVVLGLLSNKESLKYMLIMFVLVTLYYAFWANNHYFSNNWSQFTYGRLNGPTFSPYRDGNVNSILITVGLSFVLFGVRYFKQKWVKAILILFLPLILHSLILFASRGAMLSAACVVIFFSFVVKSKSLNMLIVSGFVGLIIYQGGELLNRASETVSQSQEQSLETKPLNPRLVSWKIGLDLALKYPLLGTGPQRFQHASIVHFPEKARHVAHNTLLNFSANTGLIAGCIYLLFFYSSYKQYRYVRANTEDGSMPYFINLSCTGALIAYFVGAIFLDLIIFEPFYFVLILMSANYISVRYPEPEKTTTTPMNHGLGVQRV